MNIISKGPNDAVGVTFCIKLQYSHKLSPRIELRRIRHSCAVLIGL